MSYAIVINLDYETHPEAVCAEVWYEVKQRMTAAGFRLNHRVFMINLPEEQACRLAKDVIEGMEAHLEFHRKRIFNYMKDFYGYDMEETVNLMLPLDGIEVKE